MSSYKIQQLRVVHHGRDFHFVSYDCIPADARKELAAVPAMWYLMGPGKRWPVMEQVAGLTEAEVERGLVSWLNEQDFARPPVAPVHPEAPTRRSPAAQRSPRR
jgi:hypothetical protein